MQVLEELTTNIKTIKKKKKNLSKILSNKDKSS